MGPDASRVGVDLHTKTMFLPDKPRAFGCGLDAAGDVVLDRNTLANPKSLLEAIGPFRDDLVVGCECMFMWYWHADLCEREGIDFVLGHARRCSYA